MRLLDLIRPKMTPVRGAVERFGPSFGSGEANGYILLLVGDRTPYVILRDSQMCNTNAGLTAPGDSVEFLADNRAIVKLTSFSNLSLASRLSSETQK